MSHQPNNICAGTVNDWRKELYLDFERALAETKLPERPDYEWVNGFLVRARIGAVCRSNE